jgi:hypothetical protein
LFSTTSRARGRGNGCSSVGFSPVNISERNGERNGTKGGRADGAGARGTVGFLPVNVSEHNGTDGRGSGRGGAREVGVLFGNVRKKRRRRGAGSSAEGAGGSRRGGWGRGTGAGRW